MTNVPLFDVLLNGVSGSAGSANIEVALDIEMAISMASAMWRAEDKSVLPAQASGSSCTTRLSISKI